MWDCNIKFDTENPKVGTVTAVWTDSTSGEQFTFSRDQVNVDSLGRFKTEANASRDVWASRSSTVKSRKAQLDTFMNS